MATTEAAAGMELDARIDQDVFGFVVVPGVVIGGTRVAYPADQGMQAWRPCPPYSTDWGAAGLVVERMKQDGWSFIFCDAPPFSSAQPGPLAGFRRSVIPPWQIPEDTVSASADTAPLAICRAALAAVGAPEAR